MVLLRSIRLLPLLLFAIAALFFANTPHLMAQTPTTTALPEEESVTAPITATVLVPSLNLRAGPGTTHARLGAAARNEILTVLGARPNCAWLLISTAKGVDAWVSGDARFVRLAVPCAEIDSVAARVLPTPTAAAAPTRSASATSAATTRPAGGATAASTPAATVAATGAATVAATATNTPQATATPLPTVAPTSAPAPTEETAEDSAEEEEDAGFPEGQGCVRIGNYIGPELTVTFTHQASGESAQTSVPNNETRIYCLYPGRYSVTADAPPPWGNINFEIDIKVGEGIDIPLVPQ